LADIHAGGGPPAGAPRDRSRLDKVKQVAAEEFRAFLLSFLYLYVLLGVFTLHQQITLREHDISFAPHGWALINALVLSKVMILAEKLKLGSRIVPHPLIYPIVIEALILAALFIGMHVLEHVVAGLIAGESAAASVPLIGGGGMFGLVSVAVSMFVALIPFCGFRQISHALGHGRMQRLLFSPPPYRD